MKNHKKSKIDYSRLRVSLKLFKNNGVVSTYLNGTKARFMSKLSHELWYKCLIKVTYGKGKNQYRELVQFMNEGEYTSKKEAICAFNAFMEL